MASHFKLYYFAESESSHHIKNHHKPFDLLTHLNILTLHVFWFNFVSEIKDVKKRGYYNYLRQTLNVYWVTNRLKMVSRPMMKLFGRKDLLSDENRNNVLEWLLS